MMSNILLLSVFITALCCVETSFAAADTTHEDGDEMLKQCSIWMAPSGVKGLKGYGIYTTRDIGKGESILSAPDSPSIPILDYREVDSEAVDQWVKVFWEYVWTRGRPDHVIYDAENTADFQTTFGSLPNHHCILDSLDSRYPETPYDDSLVNRYRDAGAGGFSYNAGREFFVRKTLKAGDEIFLNYGYCQRNKGATDWTAQIPMPQDYEEAAVIALEWLESADDSDDVVVPEGTEMLVASLLPQSLSHLQEIVASESVRPTMPDDLIPLLAKHVSSTPRTPEWIRANGMCLENLVPRKSTIPQAGRGGFAQFLIKQGEIVVPAPMLQITDRDALFMYDQDYHPHGHQLLMNYCFGHTESSMLLCPATNAGLINHCSTRTTDCGPNGPNAMVQWSSGWDPASDEWRNRTVDEISKETGRGLSMEIVALRDIQPGEEVFIDYGQEWEEAWQNHVADWEPPVMENGDEFITAKEANEQGNSLKHVVTGDLRKVSNHSHLFTGCKYWLTSQDRHRVFNKRNPVWVEWDDEDILNFYSDEGSRYNGDYSSHKDKTHWPCSVIREDDDGTYTVRIHQAHWEDPTRWHRNSLPRFLTKYPRESIHYFVKPYESDQHLPNVFRHPIGLRDEIFPVQWKNRAIKA